MTGNGNEYETNKIKIKLRFENLQTNRPCPTYTVDITKPD